MTLQTRTPGRRRTVLVIGADHYTLEACVRWDIDATVIVGAGPWDEGLVEVPDGLRLLRVDDQTSAEGILAALHRGGLGDVVWDAVHTGDEYALVTASLLAAQLGCASIGPNTAMRFRDKAVQKRTVAAAGLRTARAIVLEDIYEVIYDVDGLAELPYPRAVLKPVAGAATRCTTAVGGIEELRARVREYAAAGIRQRTFLLEEFMPGDEWTVDGVVFDGELLFCAVSAYGVPCLTTVTESLPLSQHRFDPDTDGWAYTKAEPLAVAALAALGLRTGVFHMELFHDARTGELAFGECGARRGGALTHEEVQAKFNVHLGECALLCSLGVRPELNVKQRPDVVGSGYLAAPPGVLVRCPTPAELTDRPGVEFARIEAPYGTYFGTDLASTNQRLGQVLVTAGSTAQLARRLGEVRAWFAERVVTVPSGARPRELRAWQRGFAQDDLGAVWWR